jgi:hypothetical protein
VTKLRGGITPSKFMAIASIALALTSCSGGKENSSFSLEGVEAPPPRATGCSTTPDQFGDANFLGTEGRGVCTVQNAWHVRSMSGVALSQPATINCAVANAFHDWMENVVQPNAQKAYGSRVVGVDIAASYACRPRNNRRGAKLSEHGFGNAIDVSGFTLANGRKLVVKQDYYSSAMMKRVRADACGRFMTVLGPGSDASHKDHFHFDLAHRKSGQSYCH